MNICYNITNWSVLIRFRSLERVTGQGLTTMEVENAEYPANYSPQHYGQSSIKVIKSNFSRIGKG